jgi:hypothetical protein
MADKLDFAILTGAGFSKGWGGLLVTEMTARIQASFHLDSHPDIRQELLGPNYEELLARYRGAGDRDQEGALLAALQEAYEFQDSIHWQRRPGEPSLERMLTSLLRHLPSRKWAFFTLNHDLLVERRWNGGDTIRLESPGIPSDGGRPRVGRLSTFEQVDFGSLTGHCRYIKLHGSINWIHKVDGQNQPLIIAGNDKGQQINNLQTEVGDLMRSYMDLFSNGIGQGTKVLVIGYSFGDHHINYTLAKPGVELYLIDPAGFPGAINGGVETGMQVRQNLVALWPMSYRDLFGSIESPAEETPEQAFLRERIFGKAAPGRFVEMSRGTSTPGMARRF